MLLQQFSFIRVNNEKGWKKLMRYYDGSKAAVSHELSKSIDLILTVRSRLAHESDGGM